MSVRMIATSWLALSPPGAPPTPPTVVAVAAAVARHQITRTARERRTVGRWLREQLAPVG